MSEFNIKEIMKELKDLQAKFENESKQVFGKVMKSFFESFPEVERIVWTQYTPYFNDGDPCEFTIGEMFFVPHNIKDDDDNAIDPDCMNYYDWNEYSFSSYHDAGNPLKPSVELGTAMDDVESMLDDVEDFLRSTLGEHMEITVTKDGIETVEYDHD